MIRASGPRSAVAIQRLLSLTHRQEMTFVWPWGREAAKVPWGLQTWGCFVHTFRMGCSQVWL